MNIILAQHHGMCFGVRDALRATHDAAKRQAVTILGQLVHNPLVDRHLNVLGVRRGDLNDLTSAQTSHVVITAHGASDIHRAAWRDSGRQITDTTCPLVHKAHQALAMLVREGYQPIVLGQHDRGPVVPNVSGLPEACSRPARDDQARFRSARGCTSGLERERRRVNSIDAGMVGDEFASRDRMLNAMAGPAVVEEFVTSDDAVSGRDGVGEFSGKESHRISLDGARECEQHTGPARPISA